MKPSGAIGVLGGEEEKKKKNMKFNTDPTINHPFWNAPIFGNTHMESKSFAQSTAKNTNDPRTNIRRATNKASAEPRPVRKLNCVG